MSIAEIESPHPSTRDDINPENKLKRRGRPQKYFTLEEKRLANLANVKKFREIHGSQDISEYYHTHKEQISAQRKIYYQNNKDKFQRKKIETTDNKL